MIEIKKDTTQSPKHDKLQASADTARHAARASTDLYFSLNT